VALTITPADVNESEDGVISETPIATLTGSGSVNFTTNSFSTNVTSTNYTGVVTGLFYGPQGVEAGAGSIMNPISSFEGAIAAGSALGPVDEVPDPQSGGGDEDEAKIAVGGLIVTGGEPAAVLQL
jgi:hypothetical protein